MGSIVLYIMEWAFALIVLLTIYKAVFSGTTFNRFNRFYLLGATVLSALLPLLHITIPEKTPVVSELAIEQMEFAQELSGTFILIGEPQMMAVETPKPQGHSMWAVILVCIYSAYVLMLLVGWSRSIIRARRFLRGKPRRRLSRTVWLVTHDESFGPVSWMNYIVISDMENGFARRASLRHEFSHVCLLHSVDLVFLLACTIVNPVCWLVLQEIKIVHEYEADNEVISRYGIRNGDYQKLLIMRTVGAEAYALASSFNLNIKKRIIMLNKNQTRKRRLMWLLILIPMLGITSVLFARTEKAVNPDDVPSVSVSDNNTDDKETVDNTSSQINRKVIDVTPSGLPVTLVKPVVQSPQPQDGNPANANVTDADNSSPAAQLPQLKARDIITGVITDADDGTPVPMVNVTERDADNNIVAHTLTDQDGNFRMRIVDPNDVLVIKHPEYGETQRPIANGPISIKKLTSGSSDESETIIDEAPDFPGGMKDLLNFLSNNINYPEECKDSSISGRVIVSFIIDKDGAVKEAEVVKSVHPLLDAEALRVISLMPNWNPGKQQGKAVRVKYTIPVNFAVNDASAQRSTPEWIYLYNPKDASDGNVSALMISVATSNEDLGAMNTPDVREFIDAFRTAQKEALAITEKYQEEIKALDKEIRKKIDDYEKLREELSEDMRASYEQEIDQYIHNRTQQMQEQQRATEELSNYMTKTLQSRIDAAWQSVSKNGVYICINIQTGIPDENAVVTPDDLESAVKDLFDGRRDAVALPFSPENAMQIRSLLTGKYASKSVFFMNVR